jgi:hypothetical protein
MKNMYLIPFVLAVFGCATLPPSTGGNKFAAITIVENLGPIWNPDLYSMVVEYDRQLNTPVIDQQDTHFGVTLPGMNFSKYMDVVHFEQVNALNIQAVSEELARRIGALDGVRPDSPRPNRPVTEAEFNRVLNQLFPQSSVMPERHMLNVQDREDSYLEEWVAIPEGATPEQFADRTWNQSPAQVPDRPTHTSFLTLAPTERGGMIMLVVEFREFRDLLPEPQWYTMEYAQTGEGPAPERKPGILSRSLQVAAENPVPTAIAGILALDYATGDGINAFGLFDRGGDAGRPTVSISGNNNQVTVTDNQNSANDNSKATAAPFFPPSE